MKDVWTIYKRELASYFSQPIAYAIIVIFLLLAMVFTFTLGNFIEAGDASLTYSFFLYLPFILMVLVPAVGMRLISEELRSGTLELVGTYPISLWAVIVGKFKAAATVWLLAIALTFPIWITVNWLGEPDNLAILSGYIGATLLACTFLAITLLVSAFTRDQVICLIVSSAICIGLVFATFDPFVRQYSKTLAPDVKDAITSLGVWDHYLSLARGAFRLQDFVWFASIILASLFGTSAILSAKRA
ncbi:ABC-2 type transport system permease protein [Haloferula luteola]|uniref:ABC-2 type transport system permease protein n=1 Tax=Haloferula luteola TaxID=595692 RepID=A0A840VL26_9BACT|nr:ABC transporter permease [Haloferula luteola]MBB5353351.1 ABC-2 type transport system permease protein [Haloferula luteola]